MTARPIVTHAVVQSGLIVLGLVALGAAMKVHGYPQRTGAAWTSLALFLRRHGCWLLLAPVIWASLAALAEFKALRFLPGFTTLLLGYVLVVALLAAFAYATIRPEC